MYLTSVYLITVNVLKLRTLKNYYFSAVRNFRNYVSEKVLVFVILECGLYHEQERFICMLKCGINVLKTGRYDSALSSHYFFQPPLNSCGMFSACGNCQVERRHVHVMSLNLLTNRKSPLI